MKRSEWCLRWTAAALAALALSGCGGGDSTLAPAAGTYAVTSNLAQPVAFKNATGQTTPPYQNTIGYGSAAFHDPKDAPNVLYTASDRGPNIDCEDVADPPIGIAGFCGSLEGKIFPVPGFAPSIYQIALQEQGGQRVATVLKTIRLVDKSGHPVTGLSNDFPKRPKDLNKTAAQPRLGGRDRRRGRGRGGGQRPARIRLPGPPDRARRRRHRARGSAQPVQGLPGGKRA